MGVEELNNYDVLHYDGEEIAIYESEVKNFGGWHGVEWTAHDGRKFTTPIQGYNGQAGEFWAIMWDDTEKETK